MSPARATALLDVEVAYETDIDPPAGSLTSAADSRSRGRARALGSRVWDVEALGLQGIVLRLVVKTTP